MKAMLLPAGAFLGALILGAALSWLRSKLREDEEQLPAAIIAALPRIECAQCGYPGCTPYAQALLKGERIDLCPPGGQALVDTLSELLNRPGAAAMDAERWAEPRVAFIREAECVGCVRCIEVCPVDAISGAARFMHTVIARECTGCELCIPACPVDCIDLLPAVRDVTA